VPIPGSVRGGRGRLLPTHAAVFLAFALGGVVGCWWSRRGDVGLSFGPIAYETYQVNGTVLTAGQIEAPACNARVSVFFRGSPAMVVRPGASSWPIPSRNRGTGRAERIGLGQAAGSFPHEMAIASVLTDSSGRFTIDVDRRPPRKTVWSTFLVGWVVVSSGGDPILHNHAAASGHQHWIAELRIEKAGFEPARVFVEVPGRVRSGPIPITLGDDHAFWRLDEVAPKTESITIYLVPDGRPVPTGCRAGTPPDESLASAPR
jgi:hypothetical protein